MNTEAAVSEDGCELSIVMPCLNEAETLGTCIEKALGFLRASGVEGEVVIADNGSSDGSPGIAAGAGARVVHVPEKGYGSALRAGIEAARGRYVIMGDADDSYDFTGLGPFVERLREGFDLVMGNRFAGGILPGAMPPLHRYLGNPVLTRVGRLFFRSSIGDFHCGLRGFSKEAVGKLDLRTTGMEFASEMVVKASLFGLRVAEVPVTLSPDGRSRSPHLRSWRDGWRHLRFLLLYSPRWLFFYPGLTMMVLGSAATAWLLPGPRSVGSVTFDIHTLLYAVMVIVLGFQTIFFAVFSKVFAISEGLVPEERTWSRLFRYVTLETGLAVGGTLAALGVFSTVYLLTRWGMRDFGPLDPVVTFRLVIPAVLMLILGCQIILGSFFLSILGLRRQSGGSASLDNPTALQ
jgi:glycosyltransferase involved in cell wall biosynthesis